MTTCIVIEDDLDTRDLTTLVLAARGIEAYGARCARDADLLCAELVPEVALIDLHLPDVDGFALARSLRAAARTRRMGLVAFTASTGCEDRAIAAGFDFVVRKPADADVVDAAVRAAATLARRRALRS